MALSFPSSPSNGQTYTHGDVTYEFDGKRWRSQASSIDLSAYATSTQLTAAISSATSGLATTASVDSAIATAQSNLAPSVRRFEKYLNTGASAATHRLALYSRHWWGNGNMRVHVYENYYGASSYYRLYTVDGHTRVSHGGGQPSANLRTNMGGHCTVTVSNWDSTNQRANVNLYTPAYRGAWVVIELTTYSDTPPTNATNAVWLDGFKEIS